jgi:N6-adenosine-specific RNA methylase IME4
VLARNIPLLIPGEIPLIGEGPFKGLGYKRYKAILCDPPWKYLTRSAKGMGKSPDRHYKTMTLDELKALPVRDLCDKNCVMFMWVIDTHLDQAFELVKAWGFTYKTVGFYWAKTNTAGDKFPMGTGHWTRANPEHAYEAYFGETEQEVERCFLNTVGAPKRVNAGVPRLIVSPRREHSRKPEDIWGRIEKLVDGPYLEMFGREQHGEWTVMGDEANKFNDPLMYPDIMEVV